MIPFTLPTITGNEEKNISAVFRSCHLSGDGTFTKRCHEWLEAKTETKKALLTTSCTHALEIAAILLDIQAGDEVIMPSYTFVSTANAFVLRGAKIIFVDIRPDTMNIDETKIEAAISNRTRAIVVVHYAGVACEMEKIMAIAKKHSIYVVEDAAQALGSSYKGNILGSIGDIGTYSFHATKNITCGEGGALLVNNETFIKRAEIIREKGTNRSQFFRGEVDKYTWQDLGSSYLPSELNAGVLYAQLEVSEEITSRRMQHWEMYHKNFELLEKKKRIQRPLIPDEVTHNAHIYYIKCSDQPTRDALIQHLKSEGIQATFHYVPLHSSPAGKSFGEFFGEDRYTTIEGEKLLRLPMYDKLEAGQINKVVKSIYEYFDV